jgi:hypothetical protein
MTKLLNIFKKKQISTKISEPPKPIFCQFKTLSGDTYTASEIELSAIIGPMFNKSLNPDLKSDIIIPWHQIAWIKEVK